MASRRRAGYELRNDDDALAAVSRPEIVEKLTSAVQGMQTPIACDVLLYNGPIEREGFREVAAKAVPSSETIVLLLTMGGGDPHAAFRVSRLLGSAANVTRSSWL